MKLEDVLNLIETEFYIVIRNCTASMLYLEHCDYYIFENIRIEISTSYPIYIMIITEYDKLPHILSYACLKFENVSHKNCIAVYDYSKIVDNFTQNLTPVPTYSQFKDELDIHIRKHKLKRLLC